MIFDETNTEERRIAILEYLESNKFSRVLDIGGSMSPWARKYVDTYVDIQDIHEYLKRYPDLYDEDVRKSRCLIGDINCAAIWSILDREVSEKGKYDFVICTHTLEDIRDPFLALEKLPMIAREGFIAVPCKHNELCRGIECGDERDHEGWGITTNFRGYFHHRWIFTVKEGVLWAFPKLNFIEYMTGLEWATRENKDFYCHEMSFRWRDDIPFKIINDDFMGPHGPAVCEMYRNNLRDGV